MSNLHDIKQIINSTSKFSIFTYLFKQKNRKLKIHTAVLNLKSGVQLLLDQKISPSINVA